MNRDLQILALRSQVGFHEGANNTNPFSIWQGLRNAAWCDSFAQWGAVENGGFRWPTICQFGSKGDAYCPYTVDHARTLGLWVEPTMRAVHSGWQILFDWNHNGVADHIGTVIDYDGKIITTIEGNYNDRVAIVKRDWKYVLGFVMLPVETGSGTVPSPPQEGDLNVNWATFTLKKGSKGQTVKNLQGLLNAANRKVDIDGDFGPATEASVKEYQSAANVPGGADGVVGENTWRWLLGWH